MAQGADSGKMVRGIAIRRGLLFGAVIAALSILSAASASLLATTGLGAGSALLLGTPRLTLLIQILTVGVTTLAIFILLFMTGFSTYRRAGRVGAGALAGLIAGGLGGLVGALASGVVYVISLQALAPTQPDILTQTLATTLFNDAFGLVWSCAAGAGLGALGAFVRQSVFS